MKKYFLILLFIPLSIYPQKLLNVDSLLLKMYSADKEERQDIQETFLHFIYNSELEKGKALSDTLIRVLPGTPFKELFVLISLHSWRFHNFEGRIKLLNNAYPAAKSLNDYSLIGLVEVYKSMAFRDNSMTDSAMTYALKARDNLEKTDNPDNLDDVLNLIADLHYWAGHYDDAERLYRELLSKKSTKNTWREGMIMRDIGLIRIKEKRYSEAEEYFKFRLPDPKKDSLAYVVAASLPYIYRMLLEINVLRNHTAEAEKYYRLAKQFTDSLGQYEYLPAILAFKGDLLWNESKYDSAISFYNNALVLNKDYPKIEDLIHIYTGLSKSYDAKNDIAKVNKYLLLLNKEQDKADSIFYRARYMTTYAEYNYNNFKREISGFRQRQTFLIIFISVISVSLFTIIYFFIRLGKANRMLVAKNIEASLAAEQFKVTLENKIEDSERFEAATEIKGEDKKEGKRLDESLEKGIILNLEKLIQMEKLYLHPEITMDNLAGLLKTNRTYLSKAINNAHNVNFATYINDLRIKEAIRIISTGEHKNLSIEGIALKAGFNNRVSFTKAFYKTTGVSPSFFIKHAGEKHTKND